MTVQGAYTLGWHRVPRWAAISLVVVVAVMATAGIAMAEWLWPQDFSTKDGKLTVYQPQLEVFKADKVNARAAIAVQRKGEKDPVFGVFWFSAHIVTDRDSGTVEFRDVKIENLKLSSAAAEADRELAQSLASQMTTGPSMTMSLDRFTSMATVVERDKPASDKVKNDPPKILFTTTPSVLVTINGNPILRDVEGTQIQRVVNTPFIMLYDPASKIYYLKGENLWYRASDIRGTWETVARPPAAVKAAARRISEPEDKTIKQETTPSFPFFKKGN